MSSKIARLYLDNINNPFIKLSFNNVNAEEYQQHVLHLFVIRNSNIEIFYRNIYRIMKVFVNCLTTIFPPHKQQVYQEWNHQSYPISEQIHAEVMSSTQYDSTLQLDDVQKIIQLCNQFNPV